MSNWRIKGMHRGKYSALVSGAAMITLDHSADGNIILYACDGIKRDRVALHGDYTKALKGLRFAGQRRDREVVE